MGSLNRDQKKELRTKGFLQWEIDQIDKGYVNYDSYTFRGMLRSRKQWLDSMRAVGWTDKQIGERIRHWYQIKKERSPFDWLKVEYKPGFKLTIKQLAKQLEIRRSVSRVFGRAYGRIRSQKTMRRIGYKGIPKPKS